MKISNNHPLAKHKLIVGQQLNHNGITYNITDECFGQYELEPENCVVGKREVIFKSSLKPVQKGITLFFDINHE